MFCEYGQQLRGKLDQNVSNANITLNEKDLEIDVKLAKDSSREATEN